MALSNSGRNIVKQLCGEPRDVSLPLPEKPGFYALWAERGCLKGVPGNLHHSHFDLLYVGIAQVGPKSTATLHSRIHGNHLGGNIASSTLRFSLAALLVDHLKLTAERRGTKVVLAAPGDELLTDWQRTNLRLTVFPTAEPHMLEREIIEWLRPPLNLVHNREHAFYPALKEARKKLRERARTVAGP